MPVAAPDAPQLTPEQIVQIRRWARRVGSNGDERLRQASRAIVRLADEAERHRAGAAADESWDWDEAPAPPRALTPDEIAEARAFADRIATNGAGSELRAAARAIGLLCDELDSLNGGSAGTAAAGAPPGRRVGRLRGDRLRRGPRSPLVIAAVVAAVGLTLVAFVVLRALAPDLDAQGPAQGVLISKEGLKELSFSIAGDANTLESATWTIDGEKPAARPKLVEGRVVLRPTELVDGDHEVKVRLPGVAPWSSAATAWSFSVDTTPPDLGLPGDILKATVRSPFAVEGNAPDAVRLTVNGTAVELDNGHYTISAPEPPSQPLALVAVDAAGNRTASDVPVLITPREPPNPVRAVHVSADAWASDELRTAILQMIEDGQINAVQLDLKDEAGVIGWDAPVPLAQEIGAVHDTFDLGAAVEQLHELGVRVIGRLVVFRDPILARHAWENGDRKQVIQTADGGAYTGGYDDVAAFTNFANETVRQYNIDVGVAAAKLGVDDILYDYIRRPDGPLDGMVFPGFQGDPSDPIISFLVESKEALGPTKTLVGVSVFGIAVTRPDEIAQDVSRMAPEVDYIAPMVYPSHWGSGEYGLTSPESEPYEIVAASLADYERAVRGTGARVVPWLQDFSLGVEYGPAEVRAQIDATHDAGIDEWLLWDPAVTYTTAALDSKAKLPTVGLEPPVVEGIAGPKGSSSTGTGPVTDLAVNELGSVPVLMYHQVVRGGGSEYDLTPKQFRRELQRLYDEGYRPITASALVNGTIDVPKGTTPVVLTFDDGSASQIALTADGQIDPSTAVGIMLKFAETHPGFVPAGTFYVNGDPFAAGGQTGQVLHWLVDHGFEVANHTKDHLNLSELSDEEVQEQFVLGNRVIHDSLPDRKVVTMALPFGVMPNDESLAVSGSWDGEDYQFAGVMLVGAEPAPSPFSDAFDGTAIPRIRAELDPAFENGSWFWLDRLADDPGARFISDGDPDTVSFPQDREGELAEAFEGRARPY